MRAKLGVVLLVALTAVGALAFAVLGDDGEEVSVAVAGQDSEPTTTVEPEAPVTMEGVAARLDCPDPPDPNGPSNIASFNGDPAPGLGEPSPDAALGVFLRETWPGVDSHSFVAAARNSIEVRYENRHAALVVTGGEGGVWNVTSAVFCRPIAVDWRARQK